MKPIYQTRFGNPTGNCYAACIASILERPLEEFDHQPKDFDNHFHESWDEYMAKMGLSLVNVPSADLWIPPNLHYIATGKSPRGKFDHSVVYKNYQLVHDPHPEGSGLPDVTWATFVVPLL